MGQGIDVGIAQITQQLNTVMKPEQHTTILLETMAGKGSEIGSRFEELRRVIDGVHLPEKVGVCLDTCHIYDAGYDIVTDLDAVLDEFDDVLGELFIIVLRQAFNFLADFQKIIHTSALLITFP